MVISFLLSSISLKYLRKAFAYCALLGLLSCKDFKNWEGIYASKVKISLSTQKDASISNQLEDLQSIKIKGLIAKDELISSVDNKRIKINHSSFSISSFSVPLNPNADSVSFELKSTDDIYYQKITLHYQRTCSLISPEAGGMQVKYSIERVELHPNDKTDTRRPIFKQFAIERAVPLKEEDQSHVTLYY